jgi:hypothetical protein
MDITDPKTGSTVSLRTDVVVVKPEGCLLVEALFSNLVDLTAPSVNLAARLHPAKAAAFERIVTRHCQLTVRNEAEAESVSLEPGEEIDVIPDVQLHVNSPQGGILERHFSEFLDRHRELLDRGSCTEVRSTTALPGFEPGAEPVPREMRDGSLLLVFFLLSPLVVETDPVMARRFDLDAFGTEIESAAGVPVIWADREVFVIQRPAGDTMNRIRQFLQNYWGRTSPKATRKSS